MRSRWMLLIGLLAVAACQDRKTDATIQPGPPAATPAPVTTAPGGPAAGPLNGAIGGRPFVPDNIVFEGRSLSFRKGKDFFPEMEIKFDLPAGKLEGKEWKFEGDKFENPTVIVGERNTPAKFNWPKDNNITIKITRETSKALEGTIDLTVKDPPNTFLRGAFTATRKKTSDDPLEADDAPYVQGKVLFVGPWQKENLSAGFAGKGVDGKQYSNMAGTAVSVDGGTGATSRTFEPQLTGISSDQKGSIGYRHTHMPPGEYIVYVKRDHVMAAWQKVTVKAGDQQSVDLSIDPAKMGEIVVTLPDEEAADTSTWALSLLPDGLNVPGNAFDYAFNAAEVKTGQKTVTVKGVPAGKYQVVRGKSTGEAEVVAGKSIAITLVRDEPKKK